MRKQPSKIFLFLPAIEEGNKKQQQGESNNKKKCVVFRLSSLVVYY
jgi:hypothetical protein